MTGRTWVCRLGALVGAVLLVLLIAGPRLAGAQSSHPSTRLLDLLVASYPDFLERHEAGTLIWKDGMRMPSGETTPVVGEGKTEQSLQALFDAPSVRDMFHWPYPLDTPSAPPALMLDPGRVRVEAFFTKMYGDCRKSEVVRHLVPVPWLPKRKGGSVQITSINGVARKLAAVSNELDALPSTFDKFLMPLAGGYNCRAIAGTVRLSAHATASAIDLPVTHADYWRWTKPNASNRYAYRNSFPPEVVRVFEKHGFIWGGKWYHYDTMHFEYRPEILAASKP